MRVLVATLLCAGMAQENLDPAGGDTFSRAYVPAYLVGRYGYLEVEYPESFKDDGLGPLKTRTALEMHGQQLADETRDWIRFVNRQLEVNPRNPELLEKIVNVLAGQQHCTRIVPYADRLLACGGKLGLDATRGYVAGLCRLGRTEEAWTHYKAAVSRWGEQSHAVSAAFFGSRFHYAWLVDRDFRGMLEALELGMSTALYPADRNLFQVTIRDVLLQAIERKEHTWFFSRLRKHWMWINDAHLKAVVDSLSHRALPVPDALAHAADPLLKGAPVSPSALSNRALDALDRGDTEIAARQALRAAELAKPLGAAPYFDALVILSRVLRQRGDLERAYEFTEEAERIARQIGKPGPQGTARVMRGFLLEKLADFRGAADCYSQAYRFGQAAGDQETMNLAKTTAARALSFAGMAEEVEPTLREVALENRKHRVYTNIPAAFMNWGECLLAMGSHIAALEAYREALAPVKEAGAGYRIELNTRLTCLRGIAACLLAARKYEEAEKAYDEYAKFATEAKTTSYAWTWQLGKARCRWGLKQPEEARRLIAECLASIEAERASLKDYQNRRTLNDNKYDAYALGVQLALEAGDVAGAFDIAERSRARTFLDEMGTHSLDEKGLRVRTLEAVVKEGADLCAVVYFQLEDRLLAWVVVEGASHFVPLPLDARRVQGLVWGFLSSIYAESALLKSRAGEGSSTALKAARALHEAIWAPIATKLPAERRVWVIPHRSLHYVPFQALHDGQRHLIEERDVVYAPSASAYLELRKRGVPAPGKILVLDPILSDNPKSPFAKTESEALKARYPDGLFFAKGAATIEAFERHAAGAGIIHVSSHGFHNPWIPLESGLVFAGERKLRSRDIYGMRLPNAALVVMSACVSSVGDFSNGDEVTGLTRAFQVAGVPNVVGSLWPVENEATTALMTAFHQHLRDSGDPIAALRRAQRDLIEQKLAIAKWAAFGLNGIGGQVVPKNK